MSKDSSLSGLSSFPVDLVRDDVAEKQSLFQIGKWNTSWRERIVMLLLPIVLLIVFQMTTRKEDSSYGVMDRVSFFSPGYMGLYPGAVQQVLPVCYYFGVPITRPRPLNHDIHHEIDDLSKFPDDKFSKSIGNLLRFTRGIAMSNERLKYYPQEYICMIGFTTDEFDTLVLLTRIILGAWIAVACINAVRFGMVSKQEWIMGKTSRILNP